MDQNAPPHSSAPHSRAPGPSGVTPAPGAPLTGKGRLAEPSALSSGTSPAQRRLGIRLLFLTAFCFGLGQTVLFAVLPPIARDAGISELQVGLIFSVSAVFWVLLSPFWGRLSDRLGRRPVVLIGLTAFTFAMLAITAAISVAMSGLLSPFLAFVLMTAARCIHGAVGSAGPAASQAYIADRTPPEERTSAMAGYAAAFGIGTIGGPAIGSIAAFTGVIGPLLLVAGAGALALLVIWRFVPEATPPKERERPAPISVFDVRLGRVLAFGLLSGIVIACQLQTIGFYLIDTLSLDEDAAMRLTAAALVTASAASLFAQLVLVRRFKPSPARMMRIAPLLAMAGFASIVLGDGVPTIILGLLLTGVGLGFAYPAYNAAASLSVGPQEQGGAAGLATSAGAAGFALSPVIAFPLYKIDPNGPYVLAIAVCVVMAVIAWRPDAR